SEAKIVDIFLEEGASMVDQDALRPLRVSAGVMKAITDTTTPQGIAALVEMPDTSLGALPAAASLVLVLAEVRDPGNAGTLIRSALGAGASAVIFSDGCVDPFAPKTIRSAAGALFEIPIIRASLGAATDVLKSEGFELLGTEAGGKAVHALDLSGKVAFVLGNEAWGLSPEADGLLDAKVGIPMPGALESLNVAVAGSLLLFEAVRQRSLPG
ncbi:MAG: RNA methyltransferase, partial [Actinobacteria bacterium]|nr:RNA methyltransferase [Actinomycetota bacterium]